MNPPGPKLRPEAEFPLVEELPGRIDIGAILPYFTRKPHCLLLDSALRHPRLGRYSFLTADPFAYFQHAVEDRDPLAELRQQMHRFKSHSLPGLPPFQGGAAGLFSYELGSSFERLPRAAYDEFECPALAVGLYDVVLAIDHVDDRAWIISQGFPELDPAARRSRAQDRLNQFRHWLNEAKQSSGLPAAHKNEPAALSRDQLAPSSEASGWPGLLSNFSPAAYLETAQRAIEYIHAGDVFQVNLAQRLLYPAHGNAVSLYQRLRSRNPAPFAAYFDLGTAQILSASPERFVSVHDRHVEARPIKGTRRRMAHAEADLFAGDDLLTSEKDRAENIMIVDLLRNDLSRVCSPESVHVSTLCGLETYEFVQHLVSVVEGDLLPGATPLDLISAAFPGGSITGAPKVRAMEIITELEQVARGAYCGSLGYHGFDGSLDLNILIRTITASRGWWQLPVGGGIVAQSDPELEYAETWHKAAGLLRALN